MKRQLASGLLALTLCLGVAAPAAAAEVKPREVVWSEGRLSKMTVPHFDKGVALLDNGEFVDMSTGKVIRQLDRSKYQTGRRKQMGSPIYHVLGRVKDGSLEVETHDGKTGLMDFQTGELLMAPKYSSLWELPNERPGYLYVAQRKENEDTLTGVIGPDGNEVIPLRYLSLKYVPPAGSYPGAYICSVPGEQYNAPHGLLDVNGKELIPAQYKSMIPLYVSSDKVLPGLFEVSRRDDAGKDWYGVVDFTGKVIVPLEYESIQTVPDHDLIIASKSKLRMTEPYESGVSLHTCYDRTGRQLLPLEYHKMIYLGEGLLAKAHFTMPDTFGPDEIIDVSGKPVTLPKGVYPEGVCQFSEGLSRVGVRKQNQVLWGYMDENRNMVIPARYSGAGFFTQGMAQVENSKGLQGMIDKTGRLVVPMEYKKILDFGSVKCLDGWTIATRADSGRQVALKKDGTFLAVPGRDACSVEEHGVIIADKPYGKFYGMIGLDGKTILPCEYASVREEHGHLIVRKHTTDGSIGNEGLYDVNGKEILPHIYTAISPEGENGEYAELSMSIEKKGKHGLADWDGNILLETIYDELHYAGNDTFMVRLGDRFGFVDLSPISGFHDVPDAMYCAEPVGWAVEQKITNGVSETAFAPEAPCTEEQIITFLWRAKGSPAVAGEAPFQDVDSYARGAVAWAYRNGIIDDSFSAKKACTRANAVTYLYNNAGRPAVADQGSFSDVDAHLGSAVQWAVNRKITGGVGGGKFAPDTVCSRAHIVTFLFREHAAG